MQGVDVSHHQKPDAMNYEALVRGGYSWLVARAAYGVRPDETFVEHIRRARDANMRVGGYLFFRQGQGAEEQLEVFRSQLEAVNLDGGDIAPVVDLEWNEKYDGKVSQAAFQKARHIMNALREEYGECICYIAPGFFQTLGNPPWLLEFPWWVAHYTTDEQPWCPWKKWAMWQFTSQGDVDGYAGPLDLNISRELPEVQGVSRLLEPTPQASPEFDGGTPSIPRNKLEDLFDSLEGGLETMLEGIRAYRGTS